MIMKFEEMQGNGRNGESSVLSNHLFNCRQQTFFHHRRSTTLQIITHNFASSLNSLTHLRTNELLMACSPYTSQSWWWISPGFMFFAFKKLITDRISHAVGFSIFLNIIKIQHDALTLFECLWIASVTCHRINNFGMHTQHRARDAAVAKFPNRTYFLDNPRIW